jgi:preprotein translocase subunit SecF
MINIIGKRYWFFLLSALIIIPGIISLIAYGLKPSNDFAPGTSMTITFNPAVAEADVRQSMNDAGYQDSTIQHASNGDYFISMQEITSDQRVALVTALQTQLKSTITVDNYTTTSASVASQTVRYAIIAVIVAAVFIMLYIAFAFRHMPRPFRWGTCAIAALLHDILVVVGIFSILGWALGVKVDALFITGMLTVAGYSVHDTIVVFDRVRENITKGNIKDFEQVANFSINETLVRSLNTSLTVLFVLFALFLLGGSTIHYFVLVLLIGIITGTYSSIFNASALLVVWENNEWRRFISWIPGVSKEKKTDVKAA